MENANLDNAKEICMSFGFLVFDKICNFLRKNEWGTVWGTEWGTVGAPVGHRWGTVLVSILATFVPDRSQHLFQTGHLWAAARL